MCFHGPAILNQYRICQHLENVYRPYVVATTQCAVVLLWVTGFRPKGQPPEFTSVDKPRSVHL